MGAIQKQKEIRYIRFECFNVTSVLCKTDSEELHGTGDGVPISRFYSVISNV